jgi:hypothetical protein
MKVTDYRDNPSARDMSIASAMSNQSNLNDASHIQSDNTLPQSRSTFVGSDNSKTQMGRLLEVLPLINDLLINANVCLGQCKDIVGVLRNK